MVHADLTSLLDAYADINSFSSMQSLSYNIVKDHFENPNPQSPLHLIINGFAGTGKSYLISALRNLMQQNCTVTATTGKASFNISIDNQMISSAIWNK